MDKLEFAISLIPDFAKRWEMYEATLKPETLIGRVVIATRSGFDCGAEGGTVMTIDSIDENGVHLSGTNKYGKRAGFGCDLNNLHNSVKFK